MRAYIISIGDEILIGQIINTNASWIAKNLNLIGISVSRVLSVGDTKEAIRGALEEGLQHSDIVFITGGLGPTSDDITKPVLYEFFGSKPFFHQPSYDFIEQLLSPRGISMNELNRQQAIVADNCEIVFNSCGTAPGMWFEKEGVVFIAMPGVPFEMETMMNAIILPKVKARFKLPAIVHKNIMTTGIGESTLAILIESWEKQLPSDIRLAYLPSPGIVKLRLSAQGFNENELKQRIDQEVEKLNKVAAQYIFSEEEKPIDEVVSELLKSRGQTLSLAESCTGGYLSHLITARAGSSQFFKGGIVAYSNKVKINQLGVSAEVIEKNGAVSSQTVEAMAIGVRKLLQTDYAVSVSGIAGPTGGTPDKPVGTVWIAVASKTGVKSECFNTGEHRGRTITRAAINAFTMLYKELGQ